jgi:signal transduction histidine kinase
MQGFLKRVRRIDPRVADALLALLFSSGALSALLTRDEVAAGFHRDDMLSIVLVALTTVPWALLHLAPLAVYSVIVTAVTTLSLLGYQLSMPSASSAVVALFLVVIMASLRQAVAAGFVTATALLTVYIASDAVPGLGQKAAIWAAVSAVWLFGAIVKIYRESAAQAAQRAALFAQDRELRAREAVTTERTRLARELHDVVGHALNVVVIQAGAAQRVLERKPELAREALASIETAGRQALADVERMLGILRSEQRDGEKLQAQPGLGRLDALARQVTEAGLPVEIRVEGERVGLPSSLDLSAYRLVQEALTNSLKHAGRTQADVTVRYRSDALELEVTDSGRGTAAADADGIEGGRGIPGMRERVAVFGGRLEVGPRPGGGFRVWACLPMEEDRS